MQAVIVPKIRRQSKKDKVQIWLNSKVNDTSQFNVGQPFGYRPRDMYFFYKYYSDNDQDVVNSETGHYIDQKYVEKYSKHVLDVKTICEIEEDFDVKKYREAKDSISVYIPQHSNRYHTNYLFKQLVDYTTEHKLVYELPGLDNKTQVLKLVDTDFKDLFYEFCYKHTTGNTSNKKKI